MHELKQRLLNTYVNNVSMQEAIHSIEQMISHNKRSYVVPINVDVVVQIERDIYLKRIVDNADLVLVDGYPLVWISKFYGSPVKGRISGADLVPYLCRIAAKKGYSIFIIGGKEGIAEKAKENLQKRYKGIHISGVYSPPVGFEKDEQELNKINKLISHSKPDILVACFGCPKQEKWIYENYGKYDAKVSICAGATVDFIAGNVKRAPKWMREHGLEWLYRITQDPKRLAKRYLIDDRKILSIVWKYRKNKH